MAKLNKKQQEILTNYQNSKLEFDKTFDVNFYKNLIKKLYGKCENFKIEKEEGSYITKYYISFDDKNNNYQIYLYKYGLVIKFNSRFYHEGLFSEVEQNLKIIEELNK